MNTTIALGLERRMTRYPRRIAGGIQKIESSGHKMSSFNLPSRSRFRVDRSRDGLQALTTSTRTESPSPGRPVSVRTVTRQCWLSRSSSLPARIAVGVVSGRNDGDRTTIAGTVPGRAALWPRSPDRPKTQRSAGLRNGRSAVLRIVTAKFSESSQVRRTVLLACFFMLRIGQGGATVSSHGIPRSPDVA